MVSCCRSIYFFNDTATTEIYTLSLHDALPISEHEGLPEAVDDGVLSPTFIEIYETHQVVGLHRGHDLGIDRGRFRRSEEHTSELQSRQYLVCRLLLEKKKYTQLLCPFHF